jgi:hypothetical protein
VRGRRKSSSSHSNNACTCIDNFSTAKRSNISNRRRLSKRWPINPHQLQGLPRRKHAGQIRLMNVLTLIAQSRRIQLTTDH